MSNLDYLPSKDGDLADWLGNFINVANDNMTALHLTGASLNKIVADTTAFQNDNASIVDAKQAAKVATKARVTSRKAVVADARALVKSIQALPDVPDTLKTALRITVSGSRRPEVPVYQPTRLTATLKPDMRVFVKWDKNGNHYGAAYVIERKSGTETAWTQIKTQTSTRFHDDGCPPGTNATYRVTATRGHLTSMPSAEASVFPKGS